MIVETTDNYTPGRSLLAEMTDLRGEMEALRKAMGLLVELQRELNLKIESTIERNDGAVV
jgi:hypothetical protein